MQIECASAISKVVVHARGALVTREVTLPSDLPSGVVDIAIPGITLAAQPGSARAALEGGDARLVSAVHSSILVPSGARTPGASVTKVKELTAERARLDDQHSVLSHRRAQLAQVALTPSVRAHDNSKRKRDAFDLRFNEAIAMAKLLADKVVDLDTRILQVEQAQRHVAHAIDAARLDDAQTSTRDRMGNEGESRLVTVRLTGEGTPGKLLLTYAVAAARWWPTYTLRIEDGGARAMWIFEALVAQKTGEDWTSALLALSSADLVFDARLPELASLRFGRAQAPKRRPYRPAPAGVDEMFAAYVAFRPATKVPAPAPHDSGSMFQMDEADEEEEMMTSVSAPCDGGGGVATPVPRAAAPAGMIMSPSAAAPARGMAPTPMRARSVRAPKGGFGGFLGASAEKDSLSVDEASPLELVPGDQWGDLDALVLAGPNEPRRGRLVPQPASFDQSSTALAVRELAYNAKARWLDPSESRGMFDHRYEATGRADVPSDGRVHRVGVGTAPCNVLIAWRSVPSESLEVYREANVINPFETALLGGPVDVYLDGSLLSETETERIDRGGALWCGMGVDDRVKVARNVRVEEESSGLLGGSLSVTHTVGIELSSTIKDPIKVVVLERIPVADDKAIEIKIVKSTPVPGVYDQAERGAPMRGGCRFDIVVTAARTTNLEIVYRLVFAQKLDIVGGSRRG